MSATDPLLIASSEQDSETNATAGIKFAGELRRFLELGAAQLDAAMRESDSRVDKLAGAVAAVASDARELELQVQALESADAAQSAGARLRIRQLTEALASHVQSTITSLQFYDKLIQRLTHVRDGLAIPSDSTGQRCRSRRCRLERNARTGAFPLQHGGGASAVRFHDARPER
jgi:hypothetical protein